MENNAKTLSPKSWTYFGEPSHSEPCLLGSVGWQAWSKLPSSPAAHCVCPSPQLGRAQSQQSHRHSLWWTAGERWRWWCDPCVPVMKSNLCQCIFLLNWEKQSWYLNNPDFGGFIWFWKNNRIETSHPNDWFHILAIFYTFCWLWNGFIFLFHHHVLSLICRSYCFTCGRIFSSHHMKLKY